MNWLPYILCLSLCPVVWAQDLAKEDAVKVQGLVEQLGHKDFKVREQASQALMGRVETEPDFAKYLLRFAEDEDPEIRSRIGELTKDLPDTLQWMDPAKENQVKSLNLSPDRLKLTFKNRSDIVIKTYWIDWEGKRQIRRTLKPGEEATIAVTFREHYWLVADENDKGLGLYCPGKKDAQIVYTGKEAEKK